MKRMINWKVFQQHGRLWVRMLCGDYQAKRGIASRKDVPEALQHFKDGIDEYESKIQSSDIRNS